MTVPVFPTLGEELIRLQRTKQPAFQDENVRLAMNYAIDKNAIVNLVFFGTAVVEDSEMPRTKFYKAQTPYTYDLAKAKKLMAASAFPKGFKTSLLISSGDAVESGIATTSTGGSRRAAAAAKQARLRSPVACDRSGEPSA